MAERWGGEMEDSRADTSGDSGDLLGDLDDLLVAIPRSRRKAQELEAVVVKELAPEDLKLISAAEPIGAVTPYVAKLRYSHHKLARLLASGVSQTEASYITGYSISRISILKNDPAFGELLSYYASITEEKFIDVQERLASLGLSTIDELQDRLESDPTVFSNKALMELAELTLDRSVSRGAVQKPGAAVAVHVNFVDSPPKAGTETTKLPEGQSQPFGKIIDLEVEDYGQDDS